MTKDILVIDDDKDIHGLFHSSIGKSHNIEFALTGKEGIENVKKTLPGIVFLDLHLPDLDGITILRKLYNSHPDVKYYLITAFYNEFNEKIQLAAKDGIDFNVCKKPITPKQIRKVIDSNFMEKRQPHFQLFVASDAISSKKAYQDLLEIFESQQLSDYKLEVVDVIKENGLSEKYHIIATPTLIANCGGNELTIIGDMQRVEKLLKELSCF